MKIPIFDPSQKSLEQLDKFRPAVIEEVHRLFNASNNGDILFERTEKNGLAGLTRAELLTLLKKLSKDAVIFNLDEKNFPKRQLIDENRRNATEFFLADSDFVTVTPPETEPISMRVYPEYNNWFAAYQLAQNQKLEDLDLLHIENIYNTVLDIADRLQINPQVRVKIKLNQACRFPLLDEKCRGLQNRAEYRRDALTFLTRKNIVTNLEILYSEFGDNTVDVSLNLPKFQQFKIEIAEAYENKSKENISSDAVLYTASYNEMTGEILINDTVVKKTNLDSLVDKLFSYLDKNPNRKITLNELKKATKKDIKDLPKVIESAGFTGNRLKAFFGRVSKTTVYFRPQITKADLKKLRITSLD